jgi:hypothetical protein
MPESPVLGFHPLHKRAFGVAIGTAAAMVVVLATTIVLLRRPQPALDLDLLSQFLSWYSVSWKGALLGGLQAWIAGFVAGWFLAFARNLVLAGMLFLGRTRAELEQNQDFLDHI